MKRLIVILALIFSFGTGAYSQILYPPDSAPINVYDENGLKQGLWEENITGALERGYFKDNQRDGTWITYHAEGFLQYLFTYKLGKLDGLHLSVDKRGYMEKEAYYRNDRLHGRERIYVYAGRSLSDITWFDGQMHGLVVKYYEHNGKKQEESTYNMGVKHGPSVWYNTEGQKLAEYVYENGSLEGMQRTFYPDGTTRTEEYYRNNATEGEYHEFHANASVKVSGLNKAGKKEGEWKEFDESGKVLKVTRYKDGVEK